MGTKFEAMIFLVPADDLPATFLDANELGNFIGAHLDSGLRLRALTGGEPFIEIEDRATQFSLTSLHWLRPFDNPDQEFGQRFCIKRLPSAQYAAVCNDIDTLISVAKSNPELFVKRYFSLPESEQSMTEDFSREANSEQVVDEVYEDYGGCGYQLFAYLRAVRSICHEARAANKVVVQVCVG